MIFILTLFYLFMFILIKRTVRDAISKKFVILYLTWWVWWLFISTLNPIRLYPVSNYVYCLLIANVFMFTSGFIFYGLIKSKPKRIYCIKETFTVLIVNSHLYKIILFILLVIVYFLFKKYLLIKSSIGALEARDSIFATGEMFASNNAVRFFGLILYPFYEYTSLVLIGLILFCRKKILLILCMAFSFLYGYIGSGRGMFISILISLGFIFLIKPEILEMNIFPLKYTKSSKKNIFNRKKFILLSAVLIVIASFVTAERMGLDDWKFETLASGFHKFSEQSIWYMIGPFRALDYGIANNYMDIIGLQFGRATFGGFDNLIKMLIHGIGGTYKSANDLIIPLLQENKILVSPDTVFNFAYTSVILHLFDLGFLGVLIFPFIIGIFVRHIYYKLIQAPTFPIFVIAVIIFKSMILTVFRWDYQFSNYIVLVVVLYLMHKYVVSNYLKNHNIKDD